MCLSVTDGDKVVKCHEWRCYGCVAQVCFVWVACVGIYVTEGVTVRYHHVGTAKKWTSALWVACTRLAIFARYWVRRKNKVIQARAIWERNRSLSPQPLRLFCVTFYCTTLHYYLEDWNRISLGSAQCYLETSFLQLSAKRAFPPSRNFYLRTYVKFTFANNKGNV